MTYRHPEDSSTLFLAVVLMLGLGACGGDAAPTTPGTQTDPPAASAARATTAVNGSEPADSAVNSPPQIRRVRFEPERPFAGESLRAIVEASDPEGDSIWIDFAWQIDGEAVAGDTSRLLLRGARKGQSVEVIVTARDGQGASDPRREETEIRNAPPRLGRIRVEPSEEVVAGTSIIVRPEAADRDGDAISFQYAWWVNDAAVRESGPELDTARLRRGDRVRVEVRASDGLDESEPASVPELLIVNTPPRIEEISSDRGATGEFRYRVRAQDPDGDMGLQFELSDPPEGMTIDALTGAIAWRPTPSQVGTHSVAVIVDDLHGGRSSQSIEVTVSAPEVAAQPPARAW